MMPDFYDHWTHFITGEGLIPEILKEISDSDEVVEVIGGEYFDTFASHGQCMKVIF